MLERVCSITTLKFVGLAVGFAAKFTTGSIFVFNAYQDAIKYTFNYTQLEVEILSSMLNVGLGVGFLPGMVYDRFGPTMSSAAGLLVSVPVYLLIWSTTRYPQFYSTRAWLMSIYFFFSGFGAAFTYTVALTTNVINFPAKHTGKVVGLLNAFFSGSASIFGTIYYKVFTSGDPTDLRNQNFGGFMLFFAVIFGVVDILCMIFLRRYTDENAVGANLEMQNYKTPNGFLAYKEQSGKVGEYHILNDENRLGNAYETINHQKADDVPRAFRRTICNMDFQFFVWMFAFASSVSLVYGNNITVTSKSVNLDYYNDIFVIIIPISSAVISVSIGILSDQMKERIPRLVLVVVGICCCIASQLVVILFSDLLAWLVIATVLTGVGMATIWSLCPAIMKEKFSVEHLGRNWGITLFVASLVAYVSQLVFGRLYDTHVPEDGDNYCYGKECIEAGYGVNLALAGVAVALGLFLLLQNRCCQKRDLES